MPPVPAAVMMCESANDVTEMSERVPVGVPRKVEPSASQESSTTCEAVRVGDRSDAVPVGHVPDQVGDQDRPGARADHRLDRVDVDVVGVGLDVDEHRDETGAHDRREVGGERDGGGDDLVTRLQPEQLDREIQRRRPRVAHHSPALPEELGDAPLERPHVLADAQRLRTTAENRDDRVDLAVVVHAPGVVDPARRRRGPGLGHRSATTADIGWDVIVSSTTCSSARRRRSASACTTPRTTPPGMLAGISSTTWVTLM